MLTLTLRGVSSAGGSTSLSGSLGGRIPSKFMDPLNQWFSGFSCCPLFHIVAHRSGFGPLDRLLEEIWVVTQHFSTSEQGALRRKSVWRSFSVADFTY